MGHFPWKIIKNGVYPLEMDHFHRGVKGQLKSCYEAPIRLLGM